MRILDAVPQWVLVLIMASGLASHLGQGWWSFLWGILAANFMPDAGRP